MFFVFRNSNTGNDTCNIKRSTISRMGSDASHFIFFMTGIRSYVTPGYFYRHMVRKILNEENEELGKLTSTENFRNRVATLAVYEYSSIIYRKQHRNPRKIKYFAGVLSREKRRYRILSDFMVQPLVNSFPVATESAFQYYQNFSPDKKFEDLLIKGIKQTGIDNDSCSRFFMEIINSVEPAPAWLRRIVTLSSELYGNNNTYMDIFSFYIAYIFYRLNGCNISQALNYIYKKSPVKLSMDLYINREKIDVYLNALRFHESQ